MDLKTAAQQMLDRYVALINSGDAGNWDPETEPCVIDLRAAIASSAASQGEPECVVCTRCGHENWIQDGKAPCQVVQPSASERQQGGECKTCGGTGYFQEPDSEVGHVARECESCAPAPAATRAGEPGLKYLIESMMNLEGAQASDFHGHVPVVPIESVEAVLAAKPQQAPPAAPSAEQGDQQQAAEALVRLGGGHSQRLQEVATFLRSSQQAMEADAAIDCDRAANWIRQAARALAFTQPAAPVVNDQWPALYRRMRNVAAGYSNYCDESGSTRRLEREFEAIDNEARALAAAPKTGGANG